MWNGTCAKLSSPSCSTMTTRPTPPGPPSSPRPSSKAADRKSRTTRTNDGLRVHSFRLLLGDLATVSCYSMAMVGSPDATFMVYPQFTPVQARAFTNNCDDDKFCDLRLYSA